MSDELSIVKEFVDSKWLILTNEQAVEDVIRKHVSIVLVKPVQSGKTSDVFKIVEKTYKDSVTIFVSDKNIALAGQTTIRAKVQGWTVINFNEATKAQQVKFVYDIPKACGKKKIHHFLMEKNNLDLLFNVVILCNKHITMVIDEADKNRNVEDYDATDDDENDPADTLPIITRRLFTLKNMLKTRNDGSRVVFVTATPQSLLVSEYDPERLVIYKEPYKNYIGAGLDHEPDVEISNVIRPCITPAGDRWTESMNDLRGNTFRQGVARGIDTFAAMGTKDPSIKQVMLISLESRNANQERMARHIYNEVFKDKEKDEIDVIVFNGKNRAIKGMLLSDVIKYSKMRKVVIIAGFMAARGVSFTDFSDKDNQFELCVQVHNTKQNDPLNSAAQAMRVFGPARRTVVRPVVVCNRLCAEDLQYNFVEAYRVVRDLAMDKIQIERGNYDTSRPLTQGYNFRYMKQSQVGSLLLYRSGNEEDWLPVTTVGNGMGI